MFGVKLLRRVPRQSLRFFSQYPSPNISLPKISLDLDFYLDPSNTQAIRQNIKQRKSDADIDAAIEASKRESCEHEVANALKNVPNMSHPDVKDLTEPKIIFQRDFTAPDYKIRSFEEISRILRGCRLQNLGLFSGERTYYLTGVLAELEHALINWSVDVLHQKGFNLISVPDILHPDIIERCGMNVNGERTQVYKLGAEFGEAALSGTSEMAIGGYLMSKRLSELPLKLCAVSRCYRAEASQNQHDKGLYRVHQFNKVEMFVVTPGDASSSQTALQEVHSIERDMFDQLGLSYRVLDMSPDELGNPAARKYDIEAWMPGRQFWGEISSCSDCTDYQARRLDIKDYTDRFCHTVNGTACAVPRMIIALCEQLQTSNGSLAVPPVLRPYLRQRDVLQGPSKKQRPNLTFVTSANFFEKHKSADK